MSILSDVITELQFADDAALYATQLHSLQKNQGIRVDAEPVCIDGVPVHDQSAEMVLEFLYLGSLIFDNGGVDCDMKARTTKAAS